MITSAIHRKVKRNHSIKCGDYDRDSSHIIQITLFPGSAKGPDRCVINHPFHTMGCRHRGEYLPPVCLINRLKMCLTERCYEALKRGARESAKWRREGDSNPRYGYPYTRFPGEPFQPLRHLSEGRALYRLSVTVSTYRRVKKSSGSKSGALGRSAAGRPR